MKSQLEQQAMQLSVDYQQKKAQEEAQLNQYKFDMENFQAAQKRMAEQPNPAPQQMFAQMPQVPTQYAAAPAAYAAVPAAAPVAYTAPPVATAYATPGPVMYNTW